MRLAQDDEVGWSFQACFVIFISQPLRYASTDRDSNQLCLLHSQIPLKIQQESCRTHEPHFQEY